MTNYISCYNTKMGIQKNSADFSQVLNDLNINLSKEYQSNSLSDKDAYFKANNDVSQIVKEVYQDNQKTICITEDHSLVSGIFKNLPTNSGLVYIDAHADFHSFATSASKKPHGMSLGTLMGLEGEELKGSINPENLIMIGLKDYEKEEISNLISVGVKNVFGYKDGSFYNIFTQKKHSLKNIIDIINQVALQTSQMGLSFDLDAIDINDFNGAYYKVGNLPFDDCKELLQVLSPLCSLIEITELDANNLSPKSFLTFKQSINILSSNQLFQNLEEVV